MEHGIVRDRAHNLDKHQVCPKLVYVIVILKTKPQRKPKVILSWMRQAVDKLLTKCKISAGASIPGADTTARPLPIDKTCNKHTT